ncbi:MAG TPA: restriction endonuclease, partial [Myxococcales bacterium]|nr:restriction endonuclease [Myxococcales bacterium]
MTKADPQSPGELFDALNSIAPTDFEQLVAEILSDENQALVSRPPGRDSAFADFVVHREPKLFVETKRMRQVPSSILFQAIGLREQVRQKIGQDADLWLIISGELTTGASALARQHGLSVIDGRNIVRRLTSKTRGSLVRALLTQGTTPGQDQTIVESKSASLLEALDQIKPGKGDWALYQRFVGDLVDYLFRPPLGELVLESSDESGRNRRDIVVENGVEGGFWALVRLDYRAHYIVIDAKNHKEGPTKHSV